MADQGNANRVAGRVVIAETDTGAPGPLVILHAIGADAPERENAPERKSGKSRPPTPVVRPGSTVTDAQDAFELAFTDADAQVGVGQRPNLGLVVAATEATGTNAGSRILVSSDVITRAARHETFAIRVPASVAPVESGRVGGAPTRARQDAAGPASDAAAPASGGEVLS